MTEPIAPTPTALQQPAVATATHPSAADNARDSWRSEELLGDKTEVLIQHGSEVYRLRRTRQGKLILYK